MTGTDPVKPTGLWEKGFLESSTQTRPLGAREIARSPQSCNGPLGFFAPGFALDIVACAKTAHHYLHIHRKPPQTQRRTIIAV